MTLIESFVQLAVELQTEILLALIVGMLVRRTLLYFAVRPKIPGPFPWPLIGNAISLGDQPQISMQKMAKKYGKIYLMKLGSCDVLVINNYKIIRDALLKQRKIFSGRPKFDSFKNISQGRGIVFSDMEDLGELWMRKKQTVIKVLHRFAAGQHTRDLLCRHVRSETLELVDQLYNECRQSTTGFVRPEKTIQVGVANLVCAMMFGHRYEYGNKEFQDLVSLNREFGEVVGSGNQIDVMPWITVIPKFAKVRKVFEFLNNRMNNWMVSRNDEHRKTYVHGEIRDIVDIFIAESINNKESGTDDKDIAGLTTDVFGAGQDTLSTVIQWIVLYLICYPECQKKVHEELDEVLGENKLPTINDRPKFPYMEAVLHEIFRHSSFTPNTIPHTTTEDTVLDGYHIPKGLMVFVNQYAANHDSEAWDRPDEFKPERFLDASGALVKNPHNMYLTFSIGLRKCPGGEISRLMLMHFMAIFFSVAELLPDSKDPPSLQGVFNLSMRPKSVKFNIRLKDRSLFEDTLSELRQDSVPVRRTKDGSNNLVHTTNDSGNTINDSGTETSTSDEDSELSSQTETNREQAAN